MKNTDRVLLMVTELKKYGVKETDLIKTVGQGWYIKLRHDGLIKANKGKDIVKGSYPCGLHEARVSIKQLIRAYEMHLTVVKAQAAAQQVTDNKGSK